MSDQVCKYCRFLLDELTADGIGLEYLNMSTEVLLLFLTFSQPRKDEQVTQEISFNTSK